MQATLELPSPSDSKGGEDDDTGDDGEGSECLCEKLHRLALLPIQVHENGLEEEDIAHEGDRTDEQTQHCHWCEYSVRLVSDEGGAVANEENDEDDVEACNQRIEIRIPSHTLTIPNPTV